MADAKRCDRCKKFYILEPNKYRQIDGVSVKGIRIETTGIYRSIDMCNECINELYFFLHMDNVDLTTSYKEELDAQSKSNKNDDNIQKD